MLSLADASVQIGLFAQQSRTEDGGLQTARFCSEVICVGNRVGGPWRAEWVGRQDQMSFVYNAAQVAESDAIFRTKEEI
jgi:hypothetical protein